VAVGVDRTNLRNAVRHCFDDGHRDGFAGVVEDARHTRLATDQTQGLGSAHCKSPRSFCFPAAIGWEAAKNACASKVRRRFPTDPKERPTGKLGQSRRSSGTPSGPDLGAKEARIIEIRACFASPN